MNQPSFLRTLFGDAQTRSRLFWLYGGLVAFNVIAWVWAFAEFSSQPILMGTAFLAYVFGLRHAFDANLIVLRGIWGACNRAKRGDKIVDEDLDQMLAGRGFFARIFRRVFGVVRHSWHMYPVGFLFGLGFDTATEIGLLGISATQAASGMNFWSIMVFPALFTAGMALVDTADSVAMVGAYGWAFVNPIRKLWYNMTITAASVAVAIFIGGVEALGLLSDKLSLSGGLWDEIGNLNDYLTTFGCAVVGVFMLSWLISTLIYSANRYDELAQP